MTVWREAFEVRTAGRGTVEITDRIQRAVAAARVGDGLCHVFLHHTSASLLIGENADPQVRRDLEAFLDRLVPQGDPLFRHTAEGPDDMPAHVRTALTLTSLSVPVRAGRCDLGTWQGVYLYEHRTAPHVRRLTITVLG
ncbi:MAG: secondary thiamine-phosphate synthase enzyme YjbQ [Sandaracinaceae bacterium]